MRSLIAAALFAAGVTTSTGAFAEDVVRHPIPDSDFPISRAVEVPSGKTIVYLSGAVPLVAVEGADKNTVAAYGDTRVQTESVLTSIDRTLADLGLKMGDVVKLQVFLVGDPARDGQMDFAGFMEGYTKFFGTAAQPNLPSRSVVQVAGLANPGFLVEIEATAVRP